MNVGDTIKCASQDDMLNYMEELEKNGIETTLLAAYNTRRNSYGFECNNKFFNDATEMLKQETDTRQLSIFDYMSNEKA